MEVELKNICKKYPGARSNAVDELSLRIRQGEIMALVGESGCGKTTTLRIIAGFETPQTGEVSIHGNVVCGRQKFTPPEKRGVGMVFQDYALFPHFTVRKNIEYGLKKAGREARTKELLELVGLQGLEKRYPHELSGGQQQRVALARALGPQPALLLLDEPFSNLDDLLKMRVMYDTKQIIKSTKTTAILVTHDAQNALSVADSVAVLKDGVLQQHAAPEEIYHNPANLYVARFFGKTNVLPNQLSTTLDVKTHSQAPGLNGNGAILKNYCIRPEDVSLKTYANGGFNGTVVDIRFYGERREAVVDLDSKAESGQIVVALDGSHQVSINSRVSLRFASEKIKVLQES